MDDTLELQLREPIKIGDVEFSTLSLSEPTGDQLVKSSKAGNPMEQLIALIQLNAKVPKTVVDRMKQRDLNKAADFFGHFGDETSTTSGTSSPN